MNEEKRTIMEIEHKDEWLNVVNNLDEGSALLERAMSGFGYVMADFFCDEGLPRAGKEKLTESEAVAFAARFPGYYAILEGLQGMMLEALRELKEAREQVNKYY